MIFRERERVCVRKRERESLHEKERERESLFAWERERESLSAWEREKERVCLHEHKQTSSSASLDYYLLSKYLASVKIRLSLKRDNNYESILLLLSKQEVAN